MPIALDYGTVLAKLFTGKGLGGEIAQQRKGASCQVLGAGCWRLEKHQEFSATKYLATHDVLQKKGVSGELRRFRENLFH
jgi:hypothetical protein